MKTSSVIGAILFLSAISIGVELEAQETPPANPYSGGFWTRSTLSGDWGGLRNDLVVKGVTLDMSLTQSAQGIVHGGKDTDWQYGGGRGDIILNVDTQKLGLWPAGF
jgi:porin